MKIQINLGSILLGKAFQELLTRDSETFQVLATTRYSRLISTGDDSTQDSVTFKPLS